MQCDSFAGAAENAEPALLHQHRYRFCRRASRRSSTVTDETLPDRSPTNQPGGPTPRKLRERDRDGKRKRTREGENKQNTRVTRGKIRAMEKEERRKHGHEDGTVQPASTSRRSHEGGDDAEEEKG